MRKILLAATVLLFCAYAGTAIAGYDTDTENMADVTVETPASMVSTDYIKVFDTLGVDGEFIAATGIAGLGTGATKAEIDLVADISAKTEIVITTNVLTSAECGKTMLLELVGGFTTTLPAAVAGCEFNFYVSTSPTTAYIIVSDSGDDVIVVSVNELETDTADDGVYDINADTVNFVANIAVEGDYLKCISNGTKWFCNGQTNADGGITTSTT